LSAGSAKEEAADQFEEQEKNSYVREWGVGSREWGKKVFISFA
jgi:hypothetical protein